MVELEVSEMGWYPIGMRLRKTGTAVFVVVTMVQGSFQSRLPSLMGKRGTPGGFLEEAG